MATPPDLISEVAPGEGPLDELLTALMDAGEVDSQGSFTLDRQKARQKMQRFQLAQPARYVLELVQAAVLRGARHISVQIEQDDLHLRCDAKPFTLQEFEQIYDALFIRSRADKKQALRHLALGASTALALKPAWVRVEGGGNTGAYLQLYPDDKEKLGASAQTDLGLHVHVRQRGRLGVLWRLLGYSNESRPAEFELLREHCGLSMVPIEINGLPITVGYQLPGTMHWMKYQHGSTRGVIGVLGHPGIVLPPSYPFGLHSTMHLMRNCVSFEIDRPPLLLPGFGTLVESPSFHLDISHQRVVRNESHEGAVRLVLAQQIQLLVRECRRLPTSDRGLPAQMLEGLMLALVSRLGSIDPLMRWAGRPDAGPTLAPRGFPDQVAGAAELLTARLWPTPQKSRVSLATLVKDLQTYGTVAVSSIEHREADPERPVVLLLKDATLREVFENVFRGRLEERNVASLAARVRTANLGRWRKHKQEPRLPFRPYLARLSITAERVQGELGIEGAPEGAVDAVTHSQQSSGGLHLTLLHQGGVLVIKEIPAPLPGLYAVLAGDFSPTYAWDDAEPDELLAAALRILLAALPALVEQILVTPEQGLLKEKRQRALRELVLLSRSPTAQAAILAELKLPAQVLAHELLPLSRLSGVPLFEALDGTALTIDKLRAHYVQRGYLAVVGAEPGGLGRDQRNLFVPLFRGGNRLARAWQRASADCPGEAIPELSGEKIPPPEFVIWHSGSLATLREALGELAPPELVWDVTQWLTTAAQHLQALAARELTMPIHEQCAVAVQLVGEQEPLGTLGLLAKSRWHRSDDFIEFELPGRKDLDSVLRLGFPRGGMLAIYLVPNAQLGTPDADDYPAVVSTALRQSINAALPELIAALLATTDPHATRHRQEFLAALANAIFPTAVLRMNYERLRARTAQSDLAETEHAAILDLVAAHSAHHIDAVMQRIMQDFPQEPVRAAAVYAELLVESPATDESPDLAYRSGAGRNLIDVLFPGTSQQTFDERALHPHPLLQKALLFQSHTREPLTLGQILTECARHGDLLYSAAWSSEDPKVKMLADARPIVRIQQDATGLLLYCLLGEQRLREYERAVPKATSTASVPTPSSEPTTAPATDSSAATPAEENTAALPPESESARLRRTEQERLLKALTTEIRAVVGSAHKLLTSINLGRIRIGDSSEPLAVICTDYETLLNRKNAVMRRALREAEKDPAAMWFLASAIYTALNVFFEGVTDDDEAQFLALLTRRAIATLARAESKTA